MAIPLETEQEARLNAMDAENLRDVTMNAFELLLEGESRRQPLVIVCEDFDWADPISLDSFGKAAESAGPRAGVIHLCDATPAAWCWQIREQAIRRYPHRHRDIQLVPLSSDDGEKLLDNLLLSLPGPDGRKPVMGLPENLKSQILDRGEGNPFFVEEIMRSLIYSGMIVCDTETVCGRSKGR